VEFVLTKNIVKGNLPTWIDAYEANGGYSALRRAIGMSPDEIIQVVMDSELKGRGGAGFPTGMKWKVMTPLAESARPRYLCCNFDEMEPGTFKDRFLVEGDPHQFIEAIAIAAHACQVDIAYVFIRDEYRRSQEILQRAIAEAESRGYVGKGFECRLHASAGRYMAGEETGLINALEGKPARPRSKPPYPGTSGAWGKPTVVNNVETLSCVPHIIERGADWFKSLGKAKDSGTKIYGASGRVKQPGAWELPMGSTMRELIWDHAGGMQDGYEFRAALPGGASTHFIDVSQLDIPLDFESMKEIHQFLGTGMAIVLDDKTCPVAMCRNMEMFFARESCGWCTPCREGLPWIEGLLEDIEQGRGQAGDVDLLLDQAKFIGPHTYCALALGAVTPLISAIEKFRDDFDAHISEKRCPYEG